MRRFYIGDGIYGFRRWVYARVLWRLAPDFVTASPTGNRLISRLAPALPYGWSYNVRVDGRGLYARHWAVA